jgi:glycine dehydrogenase subunit 1
VRYLPLTPDDRRAMLDTVGAASIDDLFSDVPEAARLDGPVDLPPRATELEVERAFAKMANRNVSAGEAAFFVGAGAYKHHVPATVDHLIQRSEFLTAYTPYQPEISQGTLQTLFEFQTQVALLTGMDVANASMYDGSTACGEAVLMAARVTKRKKAVLSGNLHPHYAAATHTLAKYMDIETASQAAAPGALDDIIGAIDEETACVVVQTPDVFGQVHDLEPIAKAAHEKGALLIAVVTEIVSLGLVKSPGEMGADIVVGEGQSLGVGLQFGGPYVGLFACRNDRNFIRNMPGRLAGETVDADGRPDPSLLHRPPPRGAGTPRGRARNRRIHSCTSGVPAGRRRTRRAGSIPNSPPGGSRATTSGSCSSAGSTPCSTAL